MKLEFDAAKSYKNAIERGLPFSEARQFDFDTAIRVEDTRKDYNEQRIVAYGFIGTRLHVLCFKPIAPLHIRVISLRKANKREEKFYEKTIKTLD